RRADQHPGLHPRARGLRAAGVDLLRALLRPLKGRARARAATDAPLAGAARGHSSNFPGVRMIRFDKVNKWYGAYHALVDVTEHVAKGEVVVVCGPSGSGKSTLIRTVNRLVPSGAGTILTNG